MTKESSAYRSLPEGVKSSANMRYENTSSNEFASKVKVVCSLMIVGKWSISATGPVFINQELPTYCESNSRKIVRTRQSKPPKSEDNVIK
jgi:hypothetical protein